MGEGTLERDQSVRIANFTELPLVYVISQIGPLYWGVIQPQERVTRCTGRVWFTVTCFPYNGFNEPAQKDAVLQTLIPSLAMLGVIVTGGTAAIAAGAAVGPAAVALAPILPITATPTGVMVTAGAGAMANAYAVGEIANKFLVPESVLARCTEKVEKKGHYANGDWLHIKGGPQTAVDPKVWMPLHFER